MILAQSRWTKMCSLITLSSEPKPKCAGHLFLRIKEIMFCLQVAAASSDRHLGRKREGGGKKEKKKGGVKKKKRRERLGGERK